MKSAEIDRMQRRWSALEQHLAKHYGWYKLSETEQRNLRAAEELYEIDVKLDSLTRERDELLAHASSLGAADLCEVAAKLAVAVKLIPIEDFPEAHRLIAGSLTDLAALVPSIQRA